MKKVRDKYQPVWKYISMIIMLIVFVLIINQIFYRQSQGYSFQYANKLTTYQKPQNVPQTDASLLDFYTQTSAYILQEEKNSIYSPLSTSFAFGMLYSGLANESKDQFERYMNMSQEDIEANLYQVYEKNQVDGLLMDNSLWVQNIGNVDKQVLQHISNMYHANSYQTDFQNQKAVDEISNYIAYTSKDLLHPSLKTNVYERMKIMSILTLEATWEHPFMELGNEDFFTLKDGTLTNANILQSSFANPKYVQNEEYEMIDVSFTNGCMMRIILPSDTNDLSSLLSQDSLKQLMSMEIAPLQDIDMVLTMPAFRITSTFDLKDYLIKQNVISIFSENKDMSAFGDAMYISNIEQVATIDCNADGLHAAAVTMIEGDVAAPMTIEKSKLEMNIDHPFLYMIFSPSNDLLYIGTLYQPTI